MTIIKKTVGDNKKPLDSKIKYALWTCYHQPCSFLCEVDPGWMVEGQETKEVEPRLPRLPNEWMSRQSRQSSLYVI